MRIRHLVLTQSFAGVERHVATLANEQSRRGDEVEVWGGSPEAMRRELAPGVGFVPGQGLVEVSSRGLTRAGVDVLHAHMTRAEVAALAPSTVRKLPLVATRHFALRRGSATIWGRMAAPLIGRQIDAEIAISKYVAKAVDGAAKVVYPGVLASYQEGRARRSVALVVQRLQPEKNTETALCAFAAADPPEWTLEVVGRGPELAKLRSLAEKLGIQDRIRFLGFRDDVGELMASASLLIAPCESEGLGLSVLEAMANGLPVIASRAGAHPETVGLSEGAQLFDPGEVEQAAAMITRLCNDPEARSTYGAELQRIQRLQFTPEAQAEATDAIYRRLQR